MDELQGFNSRGEYDAQLDSRVDTAITCLIPVEEFQGEEYIWVSEPIPATMADVFVDMRSAEFQEKNLGRQAFYTSQRRIHPDTGAVHNCMYMPEYEL